MVKPWPQSGSREKWVHIFDLLSPFYSVQGVQPMELEWIFLLLNIEKFSQTCPEVGFIDDSKPVLKVNSQIICNSNETYFFTQKFRENLS